MAQRARGGEERRRYDGLHVCVEYSGERIADRAEYGVVRPGVPVELIRRAEQFVGLEHRHAGERQPAAAVCR